MMKRFRFFVLMLAVLALAGCVLPPAQQAPTPVPAVTQAPVAPTAAPTQALPAPTSAPTKAPVAPTAAPTQAPAAPKATAGDTKRIPAGGIPVDALKNATYGGIYDKPVTLAAGQLKQALAGPTFTLQYVDNEELYGDLDGDGVQDAVVFLVERGGGSGAFTYVAAQLNRGGKPVDAGAVRIEDRIGVKSAAVKGGQVVMEILTQGPGDAACCGSHKTLKTYALQNGRLAEITGKDQALVRISAADLNGTSWTLLELTEGQPAPGDPPVTISFGEERINGSGGCNNYNSGFNLGKDNPFVMTTGPVVATQKACPDPILKQETAYFAALERVSQWAYVYGRLALYYADGAGKLSRMLFAPQTAPAGQAAASVLTANPWQWVELTDPMQKVQIASPVSYTVTFNADGTLSMVADCNRANGEYKTSDGSLQVKIGPTTMALCPAGSRGEQFVKLLGFAARYFVKEGKLYIDLLAEGGTLAFAPAGK